MRTGILKNQSKSDSNSKSNIMGNLLNLCRLRMRIMYVYIHFTIFRGQNS